MADVIVNIDPDTVCPIINRILISAVDDGFEGEGDTEAMTHAVAHIAAALVLLDHRDFDLDRQVTRAARQMAAAYSRWVDAVNGGKA